MTTMKSQLAYMNVDQRIPSEISKSSLIYYANLRENKHTAHIIIVIIKPSRTIFTITINK